MIAILKQSASDEAVGHIVSWIEKKGLKTDVSRGENETIIGLVGDTTKIDRFCSSPWMSSSACSASPSL